MFRKCCLRKGETAESLPREVMYRRYFSFYLAFHTIYFVISIVEFFVFRTEKFALLYFLALFMLFLDTMNNGIILLSREPLKKCLILGTMCGILTFIVYTISRVEAYIDINSDAGYLVFLSLLYMVFAPIKLRCIYHNFRFMAFSAEIKKEQLLAGVDFEDVSTSNNLNDSNTIDNLILGTGPIDYQRMSNDNSAYTNNSNMSNPNNMNNEQSRNYDSHRSSLDSNQSDGLGITNVSNLSNFENSNDGVIINNNNNDNLNNNNGNLNINNGNNGNNPITNLSSINENQLLHSSMNSNANDDDGNSSVNSFNTVNIHSSYHSNQSDFMDINEIETAHSQASSTVGTVTNTITNTNNTQMVYGGSGSGSGTQSIPLKTGHSAQNSMSGMSTTSSERIGSYVPRLEDEANKMSNGARPRTLSQKHPGFVAIK